MPDNPNCCGGRCVSATGEVRVLPLDREANGGNLILCRRCFAHEIAFRRDRNRDLEAFAKFDLPQWEDLKVYEGAGETPPREPIGHEPHWSTGIRSK